MRIWDVNVKQLCRQHLLGEHRELHGLWNILTKHEGKGGYSSHPETIRWMGKLNLLYQRHEELVAEMDRRGYKHQSPLDQNLATGKQKQTIFINSIDEQKKLLRDKNCECLL